MKAVYIHVPKTAGSYIIEALRLQDLSLPRRRKFFEQKGSVTFGHQNYLRLIKMGVIGKRFHRSAFKFASCRNPYDRVVSHYFYTLSRHPDILTEETKFIDFTRMMGKVQTPNRLSRRIAGQDWFRPQIEQIKGIHLDYIIRFEHLDKDINEVANILGVEIKDIGRRRISRHRPYKEYYNEESIANVQKYYREDFEFFGYDYNILHREPISRAAI